MAAKANKKQRKRGRKANLLKIESDWKAAVSLALKRKKPADGWPEPLKAKRKTKKKKA
jgi:hypothetical protein